LLASDTGNDALESARLLRDPRTQCPTMVRERLVTVPIPMRHHRVYALKRAYGSGIIPGRGGVASRRETYD